MNTYNNAYQVLIDCLRLKDWQVDIGGTKDNIETRDQFNLLHAMGFAKRAIQPYFHNKCSVTDDDLIKKLDQSFNINKIIEFSDAWDRWHMLPSLLESEYVADDPLDRQLFNGSHPGSETYFSGIEDLAARNVDKVVKFLGRNLPWKQIQNVCDIGAGPAVYSAEVRQQYGSNVVCIDLPFVVDFFNKNGASELTWIATDVAKPNNRISGQYDVLLVGNLLHHFRMVNIETIFQNILPAIKDNGYLVLQDYILWPQPIPSKLYAAVLGVHFALTTAGGRCYTNFEIANVVCQCDQELEFVLQENLGNLDIMMFRKYGLSE